VCTRRAVPRRASWTAPRVSSISEKFLRSARKSHFRTAGSYRSLNAMNETNIVANEVLVQVVVELNTDWPFWLKAAEPMPIDTTTMVADAYGNDDFWKLVPDRNVTIGTGNLVPSSSWNSNACIHNSPFRSRKRYDSYETQYSRCEVQQNNIPSASLPYLQVANLPLGGKGQSSVTNMNQSKEIKVKESTNKVSQGKRRNTPVSNHPVKPLTSYNFFFSLERERIVEQIRKDKVCNGSFGNILDDLDSLTAESIRYYSDQTVWSTKNVALQDSILTKHWNRDRAIKRKHRKTHGDITFSELTKRIANAWRFLPVNAKDVFSLISCKDSERYFRELSSLHV
jgi:hypothetical protein